MCRKPRRGSDSNGEKNNELGPRPKNQRVELVIYGKDTGFKTPMVTRPTSRGRGRGTPSDRHVVRRPFLEAPPSLVIDLGGGHVPVAE